MFILIHCVYYGVTITPPKNSGIKGPADTFALAFQEELMEQEGHNQKLRYCETESGFPHFLKIIIISNN